MNIQNTEFGAIQEVVRRMLVRFGTFEATVLTNDDKEKRGRIKVRIPEIGWNLPNESAWVEPEYSHGQVTPLMGNPVLVWFMNGDISRPIYRNRLGTLIKGKLNEYADPNTVVLFEDEGLNPMTVVYHRDTHVLEIQVGAASDGFHLKLAVDDKTLDTDFKGKLSWTGKNITVTADDEGKAVDLSVGDKVTVHLGDGEAELSVDKAKLATDGSKWDIDANGCKVEVTDSKVTVAGNLEVSK